MTLAQAQACAAAATSAGFDTSMTHAAGVWRVRVTSPDISIPVADAHALATAQGVTGTIALVEFI